MFRLYVCQSTRDAKWKNIWLNSNLKKFHVCAYICRTTREIQVFKILSSTTKKVHWECGLLHRGRDFITDSWNFTISNTVFLVAVHTAWGTNIANITWIFLIILTATMHNSCIFSYSHNSTASRFRIKLIWCEPYLAVRNFSRRSLTLSFSVNFTRRPDFVLLSDLSVARPLEEETVSLPSLSTECNEHSISIRLVPVWKEEK